MDLETLKLFTMYTVCVCTCLCRANRGGGNRAGKRVIVFRNFDDITQLIYNSELCRGRAAAYRVKTCEIIVIVFFSLSRFLVGVVVLYYKERKKRRRPSAVVSVSTAFFCCCVRVCWAPRQLFFFFFPFFLIDMDPSVIPFWIFFVVSFSFSSFWAPQFLLASHTSALPF